MITMVEKVVLVEHRQAFIWAPEEQAGITAGSPLPHCHTYVWQLWE